jgi:hypothetical protein
MPELSAALRSAPEQEDSHMGWTARAPSQPPHTPRVTHDHRRGVIESGRAVMRTRLFAFLGAPEERPRYVAQGLLCSSHLPPILGPSFIYAVILEDRVQGRRTPAVCQPEAASAVSTLNVSLMLTAGPPGPWLHIHRSNRGSEMDV